MITHNLFKGADIRPYQPDGSNYAVTAGTTTLNGEGIDTDGYDGVLFAVMLGTLTSGQVTKLKVQQSSDNGSTDAFDDLASSSTAAAADADGNKLLIVDVFKPMKRYLRAVTVRGTQNAVITSAFVILYHARTPAITPSSRISQSVVLATPLEGTA